MSALPLLFVPPAPSRLDARDPRLRIIAIVLFAGVTVSLTRVPALLLALCTAIVLAMVAGLSVRRLWPKLLFLEGFMVVLLLSLPFTVPGEIWLRLGPLATTWAGVVRAVTIAIKANAVVLALLGLAGTLEPAVLGQTLARLGMPSKLVHLLLLSIRYLGVLHQEYLRLRQAMRARAFVARSDRHTWRSFGWLVGMLLVRSLDRGRRVLCAMKCRGFDGRFYLPDAPAWQRADSLWAVLLGIDLGGLLLLEHWP